MDTIKEKSCKQYITKITILLPSKKTFCKQYKNILCNEKDNVKYFYLRILIEMDEAIRLGNIDKFKNVCKIIEFVTSIENVNWLLEAYEHKTNPFNENNLVILACKYNKLDILRHIFHPEIKILLNLSLKIGRDKFKPTDCDILGRTAFYYAIRENNVDLLKTLWSDWPSTYLSEPSHLQELDDIISNAYSELKLRNVVLSQEIQFYIECRLIDLRFFSNARDNSQHRNARPNLSAVMERIELVIKCNELLQTEYSGEKKVDEKFIFLASVVAQNIDVLKRQIKCTYDRLPWEEIEFCLICFISGHKNFDVMNMIYKTVLTKATILNHLAHFINTLDKEKNNIEDADIKSNIPKLRREDVVENIITKNKAFSSLYSDFEEVRNVYSMKKIISYIELALASDPQEIKGQLIIERSLLVTGEYLKNTLESPNLSDSVGDILLCSGLQDNILLILRSIRNLLSHSYSLKNRIYAVKNNSSNSIYSIIQNDLKKIKNEVNEILEESKSNVIRKILTKILELDNYEEIMQLVSIFKNSQSSEIYFKSNVKSSEHETIEKLVKELKSKITNRTFQQEKLLQEISLVIDRGENNVHSSQEMFNLGFLWLKLMNEAEFCNKNVDGIKFTIRNYLNKVAPKIENKGLTRIAHLSTLLYKNIKTKSKQDHSEKLINKLSYDLKNVGQLSSQILDDPSLKEHNDFEEIKPIINKIIHYSNFRVKQVKGLEALKIQYEENNPKMITINNSEENSLNERLQTLNSILNFIDLEPYNLLQQFCSYMKDISLQVATESLVFDILEITKNYLGNNLLLFDTHCPILNGKCLRNHLAHGNAIVDIFPYSSAISVFSNAIKFTKERNTSIIRNDMLIGQPIIINPCDLRNRFDHNMNLIKSQEGMFKALREGNFVKLQEFIRAGAEIKGRNSDYMSALHIAACGGNLRIIKFLLDNGLDIESKDINGKNPLFLAISSGNIDIIKYFVDDMSFPIDHVDSSGKTILHVAAQFGQKDIIEYLLSKNANVAAKDKFGYSPIHFAIIHNHKDAVVTLLQKESHVDCNELCGGFTPLHVAAEHGHLDIVNYLIENNANVNAKNDNNWIPLHGAALKGHFNVVKVLLLNGSEVNIKTINGCTPLYYAIEKGCEIVVKLLLEFGDTCKNFYENLNSVLPFACVLGNEAIVEHLLKYNINVNIQSTDGRTPSHYAAESGYHNILNMLIRQKANINQESSDGATPLKMAIQGNHIKAVEVLLQNGANINYKSGCKQLTPLHVAALNGNELIIEMLIKKGAKINELNIDGNSAIHIATQYGHTNSVQTLIEYGADYYQNNLSAHLSPIHIAALDGNVEIVELFLKQNVNVNCTAKIREGKIAPLHCAALNGNLDTVKTLVKNGAYIDEVAFGNYTPLHLAIESANYEVFKYMFEETMTLDSITKIESHLNSVVRQGNQEILELLLRRGAKASVHNLFTAILAGNTDVLKTLLKYQSFDLNATHENITLFTLAAMGGNKNIIKMLIQHGADPNKGDFLCPLYIAAYFNNVEIAHFLLKSGAQVNVRCEGGSTPLHIASGRGHTNIVEILLENGADTKIRDDKNRTALELALSNRQFSVVKTLFQRFSEDINAKGNDDWSLLHIAAQEGDCDIARYLISKGADIHAKNSSGSKPIHIAAREGHASLVDLFLGEGLSLNDTGAANQTLLHYATVKNQLGVINFLIEKSVDVNVKDANGRTSLHYAAEFGFKEVVQVLLNNSAIYNVVDNFQCTPVDLSENSKIKNILQSTKNLFECVKKNKYLEVENHLRVGACVKAKNTGDVTTLHYAAWKGYNETVISLLKNNADPNISGKNGYSCLHFAAKFGHIDVVKSLLSNGAIYNAVDHNGKTPLCFAEKKSIVYLLNLIRDCFEKVQNNSSSVIDTLKTVKDMDTVKAIMNAQNKKKQSIIAVAVLSKFPMEEQLKQLFQIDVSAQINKANLLITQEKFQEALDILKNILQKRIEIFGLYNPSTLDIQILIASALYKQRKFHEALRLYNEIYDRQKAILGVNCEDTLSTKSSIGLVLHRLGENEKAITLYEEVIKKQKELLGKSHTETLKTQLHMALVLDSVGRFDEALKNNQEVFEMSIQDGHTLMSLSSQNNIAMVLGHQKKYENAIKTYKNVYERKKKILGPHHSDTLRTLHNIGTVLLENKDFDKALNAFNNVYEIQKSYLGPSHLDTLYTQTNIAEILFRQGKVYGAFKNYKKCYNQMKAILGENHPQMLHILVKMKTITEISKYKGHKISDIIEDDTILYIAVSDQNIELVKDILSSGIDINSKDGEGRTALHYAANTGNVRIFRILLENGADIFQITNKGNTPLHTAASKGCKEIIEDMLGHIKKRYPRRSSELLDAKTSVGGTTALHICTQKGNHQLVVKLLQNGACYNIKNAQLKSPIELAKSGSEIEMLLSYIDRLFLTLQLNQKDKVESLTKHKNFEVESLRKAILYARDSNGKTVLQIAKREVAQFLIGKLKSP